MLTAGRVDRVAIAAMLARAFADDPAMTYIFPDPVDRARRLPRLFALLFDTDGPNGMRLVTTGGEAATLWRAPGHVHTGRLEMLRHAIPMLQALGGGLGRALSVADAVATHMPAGEFWYLHIAGCDPARQGRGLGGAAIRAGLSRIGDRLPVYLETPSERYVPLYASLGFELRSDWAVPSGGPRFWSMQRPPARG